MKIEIVIDERLVEMARRVKRVLTKRQAGYVTACGVVLGTVTLADAAVKPHSFNAGEPAVAAHINENFDVLYDAVNAHEDTLTTLRKSSIYLRPFGLVKGAESFNGYSYLAKEEVEVWGNVPVNLPTGAVMTDLHCYFYNNSAIAEVTDETLFRGQIRKVDPTTGAASSVVGIAKWPAQADAVQEYSVSIGDGEIEDGVAYSVFMVVNPGDAEPTEWGADEDGRWLRHYGCKIDYELP